MMDAEVQLKILEIIERNGLKIDGWRGGAGNFRDLEIGVGAPWDVLTTALGEIRAAGIGMCSITHVNNEIHPQYKQPYLCIRSVWWEPEQIAGGNSVGPTIG